MFGDNESRSASDRLRAHQGGHGRHYSDAPPPQRTHQPQPTLTQPDEKLNLPFVIGKGGFLKVVPAPSTQQAPETAPLANNAIPGDIFEEQSVKTADIFQDAPQPYETPTRVSGLRRTRLAYRDTRDTKSNGSPQRSGSGYSPESQSLNLSPERQADAGNHIDKIRLQERLSRDRERQRERERERERERQRQREHELQHKRSTIFENLTPLEFGDPDFNDTKAAAVASSTGVDPEALKEALERTPRANRKPPPPQQQVFPPQTNPFNKAPPPLGRIASHWLQEPPKEVPSTASHKRRQSLDYDDAELHAMSYADLHKQAFDFDPQTAALQQTAVPPAGGSIEERLEHYKSKGSMDQHEFFTHISIDEWDEAGDWFLAQFGSIMQRLKQARKAKRQLVQQFEDEIAVREEAVRTKVDGIGRTLEDLKQEGQTMMQGKDVDVEL
jgi:hypothetical protein